MKRAKIKRAKVKRVKIKRAKIKRVKIKRTKIKRAKIKRAMIKRERKTMPRQNGTVPQKCLSDVHLPRSNSHKFFLIQKLVPHLSE